MSIYTEIEKRKGIKPVKTFAETLYEKQLKDITNICHTDGYKEIKRYWETVREGANEELKTVKIEFLNIVQLKYSIANQFLVFLNNLEKTKETREKVKKAI